MRPMTDIETIQVPKKLTAIVDRRVNAITKAALHDVNVLQTLARSCYLQGFQDASDRQTKEVTNA